MKARGSWTSRLQWRTASWIAASARATLLRAGGLSMVICSLIANNWTKVSPATDQCN